MNKINERKLAVKILTAITHKNIFMNDILKKETKEIDRDLKKYIYRVVNGVIENIKYIDELLQFKSKIKLKKLRDSDLNILRLALYEIIFMKSIPSYASVNEAIKLMKKSNNKLVNFTNGLLRNFSNNKDSIISEFESNISLSVLYSHPDWMVELFLKQFGFEETKLLLKSNNVIPELSLRVNTLKTNRDKILKDLLSLGFNAVPSIVVPEGIVIIESREISIFETKLFKKGYITVQDQSSMLASRLLNPQIGEKILDLCAAPGGKSTHIAQLIEDKGIIDARDISYEKLFMIKENIERLGINSIRLSLKDALFLDETAIMQFDRVLLDAPCSGLGIIRRKSDIKLHRKVSDIKKLSTIQLKMINIASKYVKIGGVLVYSTCTIVQEENEDIINIFLKENTNFVVDVIDELPTEIIVDNQLKIYPHIHNMDGFYACKMKRIK